MARKSDGGRTAGGGDLSRALELLLKACLDARDTGRPLKEFAVELSDFRAAGVPSCDLRWLVSTQNAEHLLDVTPRFASQRKLKAVDNLAFREDSCFVLTEQGIRFAARRGLPSKSRTLLAKSSVARHTLRMKPRWDPDSRELWVGETLVRRFMNQAPNQVKVLTALQEEGWPEHLLDPIPPNGSPEQKRKLHDAITKLNRHQNSHLIFFSGDGTGHGVRWKLVNPASD